MASGVAFSLVFTQYLDLCLKKKKQKRQKGNYKKNNTQTQKTHNFKKNIKQILSFFLERGRIKG